MANFNDIVKANKSIKTMQISRWDKKQGREIVKDYAEVNQRIKAFRMLYPEGFICTQIISHENDIVVMQAEAGYYDDNGNAHTLGTGIAFEDKKNGMINGTSYIENCETSAVGRALGMLGLGIDTSVASYEEVSNAIAQQQAPAQPTTQPAAQPAKPTSKKAQTTEPQKCADCKKEIAAENGFTVEDIIASSKKQFKRPLCFACAHAAQVKLDEAKAAQAASVDVIAEAEAAAQALQPSFPLD